MTRAATRVGILALQGGVIEHARMIEAIGAQPTLVTREADLIGADGPRIDALILPGGESSTIDRLLRIFDLDPALDAVIAAGVPTLGTCAGLILLAREITDPAPGQRSLGVLDVSVARNAFGPQTASGESEFAVAGVAGTGTDGAVRGALIRAPEIVAVGAQACAISRWNDRILGVTSSGPSDGTRALGQVTAVAFHPELTGDPSLHRALLAA